jgi:DNA-binding NarL/FixJ family response regulator
MPENWKKMRLTPWQLRLLELRSEEIAIKDIARKYNLSPQTIKNNLKTAFARAGLELRSSDNRTERAEKLKEFLFDLRASTKKPSTD